MTDFVNTVTDAQKKPCLSGYRPQELDHEPQPYDL
jgi:hypothetical protein